MLEVKHEQGSSEWHHDRAGIVTGTTLARAVGSPKVQETFMYELIAERMTEPNIIELNTPAVIRGQEMEPLAIKAATKSIGFDYERTGMLMSQIIPNFGVSPDAVVRGKDEIYRGLEVKCPDSKKHIEYVIKDEIPKEYRHQVLAPMVASNKVKAWTFMSFDDRNYEKPEFYKHVLAADVSEEIFELRTKLTAFLKMVDEAHSDLTF